MALTIGRPPTMKLVVLLVSAKVNRTTEGAKRYRDYAERVHVDLKFRFSSP